ncbi:MAG: methyltransferase domain-containing protein [Solobacterium sp.]|nr:methyltransferase domain-containing protein [Solobacterium sp.]
MKKDDQNTDVIRQTIAYFDEHAQKQFREAFDITDTAMQDKFLSYVKEGGHVLDLGCGSGRDAAYFMKRGYTVTAADGSEKLCRLAESHLGIPVRTMEFTELQDIDLYDGIFASASIMHLPFDSLKQLMPALMKALKTGGVLYASFKYGDFEGISHNRYFTYLNEQRIDQLLDGIGQYEMLETGRVGLEYEKLYGFSWIWFLLRKTQ